jgi:hypothetical protein
MDMQFEVDAKRKVTKEEQEPVADTEPTMIQQPCRLAHDQKNVCTLEDTFTGSFSNTS